MSNIFKCKETDKIMTSDSCYSCFASMEEKEYDSRVLCKRANIIAFEKLPVGAIRLSEAAPHMYYKTSADQLVKVEKIIGDKAELYIEDTGNSIEVRSDTIVFCDISNVLKDKGYERTESGKIKSTRRRGERERKETKTSYIDNLLLEGRDFNEIVQLAAEKYNEDIKKIKRLAWSRRATMKKVKNGQTVDA